MHAYKRRPPYNTRRILYHNGGGGRRRRLNQGGCTRVVKTKLKNVRPLTCRGWRGRQYNFNDLIDGSCPGMGAPGAADYRENDFWKSSAIENSSGFLLPSAWRAEYCCRNRLPSVYSVFFFGIRSVHHFLYSCFFIYENPGRQVKAYFFLYTFKTIRAFF